MTAIFDQVWAFAQFKELRRQLAFHKCSRSVRVELLAAHLGEHLPDFHSQLDELRGIGLWIDVGEQVYWCAFRYWTEAKNTVTIDFRPQQFSEFFREVFARHFQDGLSGCAPDRIAGQAFLRPEQFLDCILKRLDASSSRWIAVESAETVIVEKWRSGPHGNE